MGKHRGNSSSAKAIRTRTVTLRCLSGGVCLSLAVVAFGLQGLAGTVARGTQNSAPATGTVGPRALDPGVSAAAPRTAETPREFTADSLALMAFSRSAVGTTSKEGGSGELNVASASLKRPSQGSLMAPLESLAETSSFGLRTSPLTGSAHEFHWGQDFAAPCGTRVYSADSGVVRAVGWHPWGGGNRVEIDHGNGLITTYNHLEAIAVKKGDSVRVDEVIARVGTTGSSTGCHLHFETILNGSHSDPHQWTLLPTRQVDQLGPIAMTSYAPDVDKTSNASLGWAIPVREDLTHVVAGGAQERSGVAEAAKQPATTSAAATEAAASPPVTPSPTTPPAATTPPATPSPTTPPAAPSPTTPPAAPSPTTPPAATTPPVTPPSAPASTGTPGVGPADPATTTPPPTVTPAPAPDPSQAQSVRASPAFSAPATVQPVQPVLPEPAASPAPTGDPVPPPPVTVTTEPTVSREPTATPSP
ncbi:MAG: family metallopeptidase [Arthrobacter sp.]|nr:family metallopeptidase [Arthrobacter sp.]